MLSFYIVTAEPRSAVLGFSRNVTAMMMMMMMVVVLMLMVMTIAPVGRADCRVYRAGGTVVVGAGRLAHSSLDILGCVCLLHISPEYNKHIPL